eukprot:Hpha_TRINITY_DN11089_c0_g1::TRINITY_DN11089_c0_g1_i1::g.92712::m.92712
MMRRVTARVFQQVRTFASAADGEVVEAGTAARAVMRAVQSASALPGSSSWDQVGQILANGGLDKGNMLAQMHATKAAGELDQLNEPERATDYLLRVATGLTAQDPPLLAIDDAGAWEVTGDGLRAMINVGPLEVTLTTPAATPATAKKPKKVRRVVKRAKKEVFISNVGPLEFPSIPTKKEGATEEQLLAMKQDAIKLIADEQFMLKFLGHVGGKGLSAHAERLVAAQEHKAEVTKALRALQPRKSNKAVDEAAPVEANAATA